MHAASCYHALPDTVQSSSQQSEVFAFSQSHDPAHVPVIAPDWEHILRHGGRSRELGKALHIKRKSRRTARAQELLQRWKARNYDEDIGDEVRCHWYALRIF